MSSSLPPAFLNRMSSTNLNPPPTYRASLFSQNFHFPFEPYDRVSADLLKRIEDAKTDVFAGISFMSCEPTRQHPSELSTARSSVSSSRANLISSRPNMVQEILNLLIETFKNIPENGDPKVLDAIYALKQVINENRLSYKNGCNGSTLLKSSLLFSQDSKNILANAYMNLSNEIMTTSQIFTTFCEEFIIKILNLLSSNESVSSKSKFHFKLLQNIFNKPLSQAKDALQSIIKAQSISKEIQVYKEQNAADALLTLKEQNLNASSNENSPKKRKRFSNKNNNPLDSSNKEAQKAYNEEQNAADALLALKDKEQNSNASSNNKHHTQKKRKTSNDTPSYENSQKKLPKLHLSDLTL